MDLIKFNLHLFIFHIEKNNTTSIFEYELSYEIEFKQPIYICGPRIFCSMRFPLDDELDF